MPADGGVEKIVEAVRGFQCLWKVSSRSYMDARAKENAWKDIASQVSCDMILQSLLGR